MASEFAAELDRQLEECKSALQDQAQAMVAILAEFEFQVKARLEAAEARIARVRAFESGHGPSASGFDQRATQAQ